MPARGTERHAYWHQKAEVERAPRARLAGSATEAYVFRPCIVAGPEAPVLLDQLPYLRLQHRLPAVTPGVLRRVPLVRPVLPDHGVPFQLVHHDDVATALVAGVLGEGSPGVYNLAGDGEVRWSGVAQELGWYALPVPRRAIDVSASVVGRIATLGVEAGWLEALRVPMLMDCSRARLELDWRPAYESQTLHEVVAAFRSRDPRPGA
jgi:nucleoside-diphosphate-sugar epimerase